MKRANNFLVKIAKQNWEFVKYSFQWILGTFLGFSASLLIIEIGERTELSTIEGTIGGAIVGLTQTILLIRWFPQPWLWMLANAIAFGMMGGSDLGAVGWYVPSSDFWSVRVTYGATYGAIAGLWLGSWQWLILRQYIPDAWRWIAISMITWAIALPLGWTFGGMLRAITDLFLSEVVGLALTWFVVSIMSGAALAGLMCETLTIRRKYGLLKLYGS